MESKISVIFLASSLFVIMLGMGLSLSVVDFKRIAVYPKAVLTGLAAQIIALPVIGYLIASTFSLRPEISVGIMVLAACPGGPTSNLITHLSKGDTALSVTLTALSSFVTILTIPFVINFSLVNFLHQDQVIKLNVVETIAQILIITIIPVTIGMIINAKSPSFALKMDKPVRIASAIVLFLVIAGIIVKERENFVGYFKEAGLASLALNVGSMLVGFVLGKALKLNKAQSLTISIEAGIQNGTLAITIATTLLASTQMAIAPAVYSLIMFGTGIAVILFSQKTQKSGIAKTI
ncbi:MAG: bile acid:sodium symporter family protein [Cytophagaceae bacterium]